LQKRRFTANNLVSVAKFYFAKLSDHNVADGLQSFKKTYSNLCKKLHNNRSEFLPKHCRILDRNDEESPWKPGLLIVWASFFKSKKMSKIY
jgi:hypothetical protein